MRRQTSAEAALLLAVLLWGPTFALSKVGIQATSPIGFAIIRYVLAAAATVVAMFAVNGAPRFRRQDLGLLVAAAICGISVNQGAFVFALSLTSASNVALLIGTIPVWTALMAILAGQERLDSSHWVALLAGTLGVGFIVAGGSGASVGAMSLGAAALGLTAAAGWGAYSILIRPLMQRYQPLQISAFTMIVGTAFLIPFGLPDLARQDWGAISLGAWLAIGYTSILALAVTNVIYYRAVDRVGAARAAMYGYLTPFLGVLIAVLLLGERVAVIQIVGGVTVVIAVAFGRRNQAGIVEPAV